MGAFLSRQAWAAPLLLAGATGLGRDDPRPAPAGKLDALLRELGHDDFVRREAAERALGRLGESFLPAVRTAARGPDPEVRWRAARAARAIVAAHRDSKATGLEMAVIDPGPFTMGAGSEVGSLKSEVRHPVRITRVFLLGVYEVTQDEYAKVAKDRPSWFAPAGGGKAKLPAGDTGRLPVEQVSWFDAVEFCNRLSRLDGYPAFYAVGRPAAPGEPPVVTAAGGNGYRLPTEAEWEFACRYGTDTAFHFGPRFSVKDANLKQITGGGYGGPVEEASLGRTAAVGSYKPNARGLHDMHGNVAEWCQDWYGAGYYAASPVDDPPGPADGAQRVGRGGSWLVSSSSGRSASRAGYAPADRSFQVGFRVARSP